MKKILLSVFSVIAFGAFAQPDVAIRLASPQNNSTIVAGTQFNFQVTIKNEGTEPIDAADTVIYQPLFNGSAIGNGQGGVLSYGFTGATIAPGDSSARPAIQLNLSGPPTGNYQFCAVTVVIGAGWNGVAESDTSNNSACSSVSWDDGGIGVGEFTVLSSNDNSYYNNGTFFVKMKNYAFDNRAEMKVYNTVGAEVFSSELAPNGSALEQEVDLSQLKTGIYIVKVAGGNNVAVTHKIMVK